MCTFTQNCFTTIVPPRPPKISKILQKSCENILYNLRIPDENKKYLRAAFWSYFVYSYIRIVWECPDGYCSSHWTLILMFNLEPVLTVISLVLCSFVYPWVESLFDIYIKLLFGYLSDQKYGILFSDISGIIL